MSEEGKVIFWSLPPSANSSVIRCFMNVNNIEYEEKNAWGQTRTPEFIAKFPNNTAPSIEHHVNGEEIYVTETLTIMRYLARVYPETAGKYYDVSDPKIVSKIDMVMDYTHSTLAKALPLACYPVLGFPSYPGEVGDLEETKPHIDKSVEAATKYLSGIINDKYVDIFLKDTKFLCSDTPTIADFRFAPMLSTIKVSMKLPERIETYLQDCYNEMSGFEDGMKPSEEFCSAKFV